MWEGEIRCETCPIFAALMDGDHSFFRRNCTRACPLNRKQNLPNAELWNQLDELRGWRASEDTQALATEVLKLMPIDAVRVFTFYSRAHEFYLAAAQERLTQAGHDPGKRGAG